MRRLLELRVLQGKQVVQVAFLLFRRPEINVCKLISLCSLLFQFLQYAQDFRQYIVCLLQNLVVPKTQYGKAQTVEICRPRVVVCGLFCVLSAVYFDNQLGRYAHKINNIIPHRLLAAEFVAVQTACPQVLPQFCFRLAHFLTHGFGALAQDGVVGGQEFLVRTHFVVGLLPSL